MGWFLGLLRKVDLVLYNNIGWEGSRFGGKVWRRKCLDDKDFLLGLLGMDGFFE